jgi:hypothetical protein
MLPTHRTARALLGVTLAAALLGVPARASEVDKYLPDGTFLVVSFNVKQLLDAPLVKGDEKAFQKNMGEAAKLLEGFGVDPAKDVDRLVLAVGDQLKPQNVLLLMEGKFDPAKVQAKLKEMAQQKKNNLEVTSEGGVTIYEGRLPKPAMPNPAMPSRFLLTVLDNRFIAFAVDKDALKEAASKKAGDRKPAIKKEVTDLVEKINPKETAALVVVPPPALTQGNPAAAGLNSITGGVTVGEGVKTDILLSTKDADAAKNLAQIINDALNQIKQLLPLFAGQQPGFGPKEQALVKDLMDTFKATAKETSVTIKSTISKEFIEKNSKKDQ